MFARLITFKLKSPDRPKMEQISGKLVPSIRIRQGFRGIHYFADDKNAKYGAFILWASKDYADESFDDNYPKLLDALEGLLKEEPEQELFEIVEPKEK